MIRFVSDLVDLRGLAADAVEEGREVVRVVGTADKGETLDAFGAALSFPSWCGRNLDAFADCLDDRMRAADQPFEIVWEGAELLQLADETAFAGVCDVLAETSETHPGTQVTVILARS